MKNVKSKERKVHVALPGDVHQKLRVKCALEDVTIQQYVSSLIERDVSDVQLPSAPLKGPASEMSTRRVK
jgi:predicted DNA binding CopG/RHH family protein